MTSFPVKLKVAHIPSPPPLRRMKQLGLCMTSSRKRNPASTRWASPIQTDWASLRKAALGVSGGLLVVDQTFFITSVWHQSAEEFGVWSGYKGLETIFSLQTQTLTGGRIICRSTHLLWAAGVLLGDVQIWHMCITALSVQEYWSRGGNNSRCVNFITYILGEKRDN